MMMMMTVMMTELFLIVSLCLFLREVVWGGAGARGVNGRERTGTAFQLVFLTPERRSCSLLTCYQNAVQPTEQKSWATVQCLWVILLSSIKVRQWLLTTVSSRNVPDKAADADATVYTNSCSCWLISKCRIPTRGMLTRQLYSWRR